jgi:hypothetical protein
VIDDEDFNRAFGGFEAQTELLLHGGEDGGLVGGRAGARTRIGRLVKLEVVFSRQPGRIGYIVFELPGQHSG